VRADLQVTKTGQLLSTHAFTLCVRTG
jgi:hypothetical protein